MKTIQVKVCPLLPETLTISYIDKTHFRAYLIGGFSTEGHVYHIDEAKKESYYETVKAFLEEGE